MLPAILRSLFCSGKSSKSKKMAQVMNEARAKDILKNVDNFLFDCDGVLWDGSGVIEGSLETVLKLKQLGKNIFYVTNNSTLSRQGYADECKKYGFPASKGKRVYYVTNNSSQSRADYVDKCKKFGYPADKEEIVCTAYIAAQFLHKLNFQDKVYLIGRQESIGEELNNVGIKYIGTGPDPLVGQNYKDWLDIVELDPEVKCVLVGFDPHISYMKLMRAASYLKKQDCLFIATNEDGSLPMKEATICIPGTGCMVLPIKLASGREPDIMGKPSTLMFDTLKAIHNLDPSRSLMTGDRISTDIMFGQKCGMRTLLVLSGIATMDDIARPGHTKETEEMKSGQPDLYCQNLAQFGKYI